MSEFLSAEQERALKRATNERIALIRKMGSGRKLGHLADVENPNRQIRKSDCETAIAGLHRTGNSRATIAKVAKPGNDAGATMIARMHQSPGEFADREIRDDLVLKLAGAVVQAVQKDYSSAREARREIKKLIETESSADQPRPKTHEVIKTGKAKSGKVTMTYRKGSASPYLIECDGLYHSEHQTADRAEKTFAALMAS